MREELNAVPGPDDVFDAPTRRAGSDLIEFAPPSHLKIGKLCYFALTRIEKVTVLVVVSFTVRG